MEIYEATELFSSLSQETRLRALKLLIKYGKDGLAAGKIAKELKVPDNTLSFHLSHMSKVGLVSVKKEGRSLVYYTNTTLMKNLVGYLQDNCCVLEKSKDGKVRSC